MTKPLCELLAIPKGITSFVGGGGKTSLIERLATELSKSARVLRLTTTRIWKPKGELLLSPDVTKLREAFERANLVSVGELGEGGKLRAPDAPIAELAALADYTLVEADGTRGLPLKAPNENEPVLVGAEGLVIAVAGIQGVGQPIQSVAHRPERYAALLGKRVTDTVTAQDAAYVLQSESGQRKGVRCRYLVALNQCDTRAQEETARECAELLCSDCALLSLQERPNWAIMYHEGKEVL